jgi:hypothetical protein
MRGIYFKPYTSCRDAANLHMMAVSSNATNVAHANPKLMYVHRRMFYSLYIALTGKNVIYSYCTIYHS